MKAWVETQVEPPSRPATSATPAITSVTCPAATGRISNRTQSLRSLRVVVRVSRSAVGRLPRSA